MYKVNTYWEVRFDNWSSRNGSAEEIKGPFKSEAAARLAALNLATDAPDPKKHYVIHKVEIHEEKVDALTKERALAYLATSATGGE